MALKKVAEVVILTDVVQLAEVIGDPKLTSKRFK